MFEFIRKGVGGVVAGILLSLLIASFALWGIGDPMGGIGSSEVAEIGSQKLGPNDLARTFNNEYNQLLQRAGDSLTKELAVQIGIGTQAVTKMVERKAYDVEAENLGLRITDDELRDYIFSIPSFQDGTGIFNKSFFDQLARSQGFTSSEFEDLIRSDLIRNHLVGGLMNNIAAPDISTNTLTRFVTEQRASEILSIPASSMTSIGEVTDEILTTYYEENNDRYMAPEYRDLSYFEISANDFTDQVEISEDMALQSYEARLFEFTKEEERGFMQMLLDDEEVADAAFSELENGKSFEDVVSDRTGDSAEDATFEAQSRTSFAETYGEDAAAVVFALPENEYSGPIETGFGVYLFKVTGINQGTSENFEDVKDGIITDLKMDQASDILYDMRNKIDDELAAGAPIAEIAEVLSFELKTVSNVSIEAMTPDGTASDELPLIVDFLDRAFTSEVGDDMELYEGISNKFYMISVDNIIDSTLREFEEVKEDVNSDWARNRREELSSELATKITEEYGLAENAEKALADYEGMSSDYIVNEVNVGRDNADSAVSTDIHNSIFTQDIGGIEMIPAANGDGYVLVRVKSRQFKEEVDEAALTQTRDQITTSYQNDLMGAYISHLYESLPVVVNNNDVNSVLDQIAAPLE